jgi:hypothetical protein
VKVLAISEVNPRRRTSIAVVILVNLNIPVAAMLVVQRLVVSAWDEDEGRLDYSA